MKKPNYGRLPKSLGRYWERQDKLEYIRGFSFGMVTGAIMVAIAWLISIWS